MSNFQNGNIHIYLCLLNYMNMLWHLNKCKDHLNTWSFFMFIVKVLKIWIVNKNCLLLVRIIKIL